MTPVGPGDGILDRILSPDGSGLGWLVLLLVVTAAGILWLVHGARYARRRLRCPVHGRMATVRFRREESGRPAEVVRCSLFGRLPVTCDGSCLPGVHPG
jgi:hypothetical protein